MARQTPKCAKWFAIAGSLLLLGGIGGMALEVWLDPPDNAEMPYGMWPFLLGALLLCAGALAADWRVLLMMDDEEDDE